MAGRRCLSLLLLLFLSVLPTVLSVPIYTSSDGTGTACSSFARCALPEALSQASNGDTIYLQANDTYLINSTLRVGPTFTSISIFGESDTLPPTLQGNTSLNLLQFYGPGSVSGIRLANIRFTDCTTCIVFNGVSASDVVFSNLMFDSNMHSAISSWVDSPLTGVVFANLTIKGVSTLATEYLSVSPINFDSNVINFTLIDSTISEVSYPNCSYFPSRWACESYNKPHCALGVAIYGDIASQWTIKNVNVSNSAGPSAAAFYFGNWDLHDGVADISLEDVTVTSLRATNNYADCGGVVLSNSGISNMRWKRVTFDSKNAGGAVCGSGSYFRATSLVTNFVVEDSTFLDPGPSGEDGLFVLKGPTKGLAIRNTLFRPNPTGFAHPGAVFSGSNWYDTVIEDVTFDKTFSDLVNTGTIWDTFYKNKNCNFPDGATYEPEAAGQNITWRNILIEEPSSTAPFASVFYFANPLRMLTFENLTVNNPTMKVVTTLQFSVWRLTAYYLDYMPIYGEDFTWRNIRVNNISGLDQEFPSASPSFFTIWDDGYPTTNWLIDEIHLSNGLSVNSGVLFKNTWLSGSTYSGVIHPQFNSNHQNLVFRNLHISDVQITGSNFGGVILFLDTTADGVIIENSDFRRINGFIAPVISMNVGSGQSAIIRNCIFESCVGVGGAQSRGGAIQVVGPGSTIPANITGALTIDNCTFTNNRIAGTGTNQGGAVITGGLDVTIRNSTFRGNGGAQGSGLFVTAPGTLALFPPSVKLIITDCTFADNVATSGGAGMTLFFVELILSNTVFSNNTVTNTSAAASHFGSAIRLVPPPNGTVLSTIDNCDFTGSNAYTVSLTSRAGGSLRVSNSRFWANSGSGAIFSSSQFQKSIEFTQCTMWNNGQGANAEHALILVESGAANVTLDRVSITSDFPLITPKVAIYNTPHCALRDVDLFDANLTTTFASPLGLAVGCDETVINNLNTSGIGLRAKLASSVLTVRNAEGSLLQTGSIVAQTNPTIANPSDSLAASSKFYNHGTFVPLGTPTIQPGINFLSTSKWIYYVDLQNFLYVNTTPEALEGEVRFLSSANVSALASDYNTTLAIGGPFPLVNLTFVVDYSIHDAIGVDFYLFQPSSSILGVTAGLFVPYAAPNTLPPLNPPVAPTAPPVDPPIAPPVAAPTSPPTPETQSPDSAATPSPVAPAPEETDVGLIAGLVVGLIGLGAIVLAILLLLLRRRRLQRKEKENATQSTSAASLNTQTGSNGSLQLPREDGETDYTSIAMVQMDRSENRSKSKLQRQNSMSSTESRAEPPDDSSEVSSDEDESTHREHAADAASIATEGKTKRPNREKLEMRRWQIKLADLRIGPQIGKGSYGIVYQGEWRNLDVAIKEAKIVAEDIKQDFFTEARLMLRLRPHGNVIQVFGVAQKDNTYYIVMERAYGSLDRLVYHAAEGYKPLREKKVIALATGIAIGMTHLSHETLVHRDLAARNILLGKDGTPKISDFGMSRKVSSDITSGETKSSVGPVPWMAPESVMRKFSTKSDVWAYGCVLYEIAAGHPPHKGRDLLEVALDIRDSKANPGIPEKAPEVFKKLMAMCWEHEPSDRPTFDEIVKILKEATPPERSTKKKKKKKKKKLDDD